MSIPRATYDPPPRVPLLTPQDRYRAQGPRGGNIRLGRSVHRLVLPHDRCGHIVQVHIAFVDWIPAICSTLGFLVTSMLDKTHLRSAFSGDSWGTDGPAAYRARIVLFIGVALMAGGLAGSLTVLILKYIQANPDYVYFGIANVGMNAGVMLSAMILWVSQSGSDEYEYQLTV
ncbi:hypothetical protein CcaverHIS002_0506620 [Cutaneotrichosporon cavernicola]|nr:hypothetical protein CcaverHIS002_0506620 [Cutaneotrichosporon cavernicola]